MCEDKSRIEPLDPNRAPRRIMVDVWYPADSVGARASPPAVYLDVKAIERVIGPEGLRKQLGTAYEEIRKGNVTTHANEGAAFTSSFHRAPLLIFSPGGGMIRDLYAAQLEYLASHGYVVAAITHSYDGFITMFPGGSSVVYDSKRWPSQPSVEGEANLNQLEWHADDAIFVLDELSHAPSGTPFAGPTGSDARWGFWSFLRLNRGGACLPERSAFQGMSERRRGCCHAAVLSGRAGLGHGSGFHADRENSPDRTPVRPGTRGNEG